MEVVKERLEREFNLDLIATSPSVDYHVYKTDGEMIDVRSPQDLPEATRIERIEEPYLKAKIICPPEYTGAVMQLAIEHRGVTTDMIHLTSKSVEMRFDMPLAELILDFFDQLKSRTKGYASLDYEFNEYRPSELVKLDILLSGDEVDALSFIVHKDKAYGPPVVCATNLRRSSRVSCSRFPSVVLSATRSSPVLPSKRVARTFLLSATAAISRVSASCLRSRKRARSA